MTDHPTTPSLSPSEARTRQRQRRQIIYLVIAGILGAGIGFFTGFYNTGDGNLFSGDIAELSLPPAVAIGLAVALFGSLLVLPPCCHTPPHRQPGPP